jgi:chemotaxis protein MotB
MLNRIAVTALVACAVIFAGCSNVQKGAGAGGLGGAAVGTTWATTTGATLGTGALAGLGVGTVSGALAADYYYGEEAAELTKPPQEKLSKLEKRLQNTKQQNKQLMQEIKQANAQKRALLEAHEKTKKKLESMQNKLSGDVKVSREDGEVTFTILSEVLFPEGKASLQSRGKKALGEAAEVIRNNFPDAKIEVHGHTDNQPIRYSDWESNWELSAYRALNVLNYLRQEQGFQGKRLSFSGHGATQPVASNETTEGRRQNRRAEIVVIPGGKKVEYKRKTARSE